MSLGNDIVKMELGIVEDPRTDGMILGFDERATEAADPAIPGHCSRDSTPASLTGERDSVHLEPLTYELQQGLRILRELMSDGNKSVNWAFMDPVDVKEQGLWDYEERIKQPMWLMKMREKFDNRNYETITEFVADFRLMLENCYRYNGPDHQISKRGQKLEIVLEQKLALLSREHREKTSIEATSGDPGEGVYRRRGRSIVPHDSSQLLRQLRHEEAQRGRDQRRLQVMERKQVAEAYLQELQEWEDQLLAEPNRMQIRNSCEDALNIGEVTQYELERCFLLARESSTMKRVMTSLLSTAHQRTKLDVKPMMPYYLWESKLRDKLRVWYKILNDYNRDVSKTSDKLGLYGKFFEVMGLKNPLEKKKYHELTLYQKICTMKALCDYCVECQESLRDAIEVQPAEESREYFLGVDGGGNTYLHFPQFCGADLRIYKQTPINYTLSPPRKVQERRQHHEDIPKIETTSRSHKKKRRKPRSSRNTPNKKPLIESRENASTDTESITDNVSSVRTEVDEKAVIDENIKRVSMVESLNAGKGRDKSLVNGSQDVQNIDGPEADIKEEPDKLIQESEEEDIEEVTPELGVCELTVDSVEDLRLLAAKFEEKEPAPQEPRRKGRRSRAAKTPVRKRCEVELYERLKFLLSELEPWESRLMQANKKAKIKLRREQEEYAEEEMQEIDDVWESEDLASEGSSDEDETQSVHSNQSSQRTPRKRQIKPPDVADSLPKGITLEDLFDVSSRGRVRKRRLIPNNMADQGLRIKKRREGALTPVKTDATADTQVTNASPVSNNPTLSRLVLSPNTPDTGNQPHGQQAPRYTIVNTSKGPILVQGFLELNNVPNFLQALQGTSASLQGTSASLQGTSASLQGTSTSLQGTSASLQGTSASLQGTSASLQGTSASPLQNQSKPIVVTKMNNKLVTMHSNKAPYYNYNATSEMPANIRQALLKDESEVNRRNTDSLQEVTQAARPESPTINVMPSSTGAPLHTVLLTNNRTTSVTTNLAPKSPVMQVVPAAPGRTVLLTNNQTTIVASPRPLAGVHAPQQYIVNNGQAIPIVAPPQPQMVLTPQGLVSPRLVTTAGVNATNARQQTAFLTIPRTPTIPQCSVTCTAVQNMTLANIAPMPMSASTPQPSSMPPQSPVVAGIQQPGGNVTLLQLIGSPPKSNKYASNLTVKALLEAQKGVGVPKKELHVAPSGGMCQTPIPSITPIKGDAQPTFPVPVQYKALPGVGSGHRSKAQSELAAKIAALGKPTAIDTAVKTVVTSVPTSLPTLQIKVPSPLTMPQVQPRRSVTQITQAMKSPISVTQTQTRQQKHSTERCTTTVMNNVLVSAPAPNVLLPPEQPAVVVYSSGQMQYVIPRGAVMSQAGGAPTNLLLRNSIPNIQGVLPRFALVNNSLVPLSVLSQASPTANTVLSSASCVTSPQCMAGAPSTLVMSTGQEVKVESRDAGNQANPNQKQDAVQSVANPAIKNMATNLPQDQKLLLLNINGQLMTSQGTPVTISNGALQLVNSTQPNSGRVVLKNEAQLAGKRSSVAQSANHITQNLLNAPRLGSILEQQPSGIAPLKSTAATLTIKQIEAQLPVTGATCSWGKQEQTPIKIVAHNGQVVSGQASNVLPWSPRPMKYTLRLQKPVGAAPAQSVTNEPPKFMVSPKILFSPGVGVQLRGTGLQIVRTGQSPATQTAVTSPSDASSVQDSHSHTAGEKIHAVPGDGSPGQRLPGKRRHRNRPKKPAKVPPTETEPVLKLTPVNTKMANGHMVTSIMPVVQSHAPKVNTVYWEKNGKAVERVRAVTSQDSSADVTGKRLVAGTNEQGGNTEPCKAAERINETSPTTKSGKSTAAAPDVKPELSALNLLSRVASNIENESKASGK